MATQYILQNRPMPSDGLLPEQMLQALRSMDYDPLLLAVENHKQAKHDIYTYIESEVPPILLCNFATGGHHAIAAVGHGYNLPISSPTITKVEWPDAPSLEFARSSEWVPSVLVNDDQRGPYRRLTFIEDVNTFRNVVNIAHPDVDTTTQNSMNGSVL